MRVFGRLMGVLSCCFGSALLLRLELCNHHLSRHGITDPAAQRQQGNEEGNEQVAHEKFRCKDFQQFVLYTKAAHTAALRTGKP